MTSFNHTNSTRERFRQHQANKDAERAAMAEREYIARLEALCVKPWNRRVNARTHDRAQALAAAA